MTTNNRYPVPNYQCPKQPLLNQLSKRVEPSVISVCKGLKGLTDAFYGCEKVEKTFCFVIYSYLQDTAFTAVERGMQSSKLVRGERGTLVNRTVYAGTFTGNIDMLLSEGFVLPSKGKGLLQHTVSALARLTFYENLSIGQGTSIRYPR